MVATQQRGERLIGTSFSELFVLKYKYKVTHESQ